MPRDGLSFAIRIGCQIDDVGGFGGGLQLGDLLFLARHDLVTRGPAVFGIDAHAADQGGTRLGLLLRRSGLGRTLGLGLARGLQAVGGALFARIATRRQVANMAERGLHHEVLAQVFIDRLGFGRRLDDDKAATHELSTWWVGTICGQAIGGQGTPFFGPLTARRPFRRGLTS